MAQAEPTTPLRETATAWCAEYVAERRTRAPRYLSEWCAKRLAAGPVASRSGYAPASTTHTTMSDEEFRLQLGGDHGGR